MLNLKIKERLDGILKPTKLIYSPIFSKESGLEALLNQKICKLRALLKSVGL